MKMSTRFKVALVCLLGFVLNFTAYYPGFMSPDTFEQYKESLEHVYYTWHPPFMAYLWSLLNYISKGPQVMLALQLTLLWSACYLLATAADKRWWRITIVILFLAGPVIQNFAGYIIKDVQMCYSWLLAAVILLRSVLKNRSLSKTEAIASAMLLLYGTWLRHNAITGLLPLCFLWGWRVCPNKTMVYRSVLSVGLFTTIIIGHTAFIQLLKPKKLHPEYIMYMYDLTGIYLETGDNVFPAFCYTLPHFDTSLLRREFTPASYDPFWWFRDGTILIPNDYPDSSEVVQAAWLKAIKEYPGVYLRNKYEGSQYFLRIKNRASNLCNAYYAIFPDPNPYGFVVNYQHFYYKNITPYIYAQNGMPYMQPWFWVLLNIVLFSVTPLIKSRGLRYYFIGVVSSGILYVIPMFFMVTNDADFRYYYWNCFSCILAIFAWIADRQQKRVASATP